MRVEPSNPAPTPTISEHDPAADSRDLSPDIGALPRAGTRWPPTSSHSVGSPTVLDRPAGVAADFAVVPFVDEGSLARPASHSSSLDVDGLFEEWAERLEDAAEQLGIDLED
jgi:hypothetical protein